MTAALEFFRPSLLEGRSWTIHDSNAALYECLSKRNPPIPSELILLILDDPSRWIRTKSTDTPKEVEKNPIRVGLGYQNHGEQPILTTTELSPVEVGHLRSIVFTFTSRDQGFSHDRQHHGTYDASWTWMEASRLRNMHLVECQPTSNEEIQSQDAKEMVRYELQRNRHAGKSPENYTHELGRDHELLRSIDSRDRVVLWARTMFPAWENRVFKASVEVWCMDDLTGLMESTV